MFPSWPYEALTVGSPIEDANDFTVSDVGPVIVVSSITCGAWLFLIESEYREQTIGKKISRENEKLINWKIRSIAM